MWMMVSSDSLSILDSGVRWCEKEKESLANECFGNAQQ